MATRPRVVIVCNPAKHDARAIMASLAAAVHAQATVEATGSIADLPALAGAGLDRIIVLGGDGSILEAVRAMGSRQVPIVGVNFGKLGYLAEFGLDDLQANLNLVLTDPGIVSRRMMLSGIITRRDHLSESFPAVNDVVVIAGPPYRMIEMSVAINDQPLTRIRGDGLILATPSGSTAHNMSAGGPIIQSEVSAIALTPIAPHSLTHRPLVVAGDSVIEVTVATVNKGTTVVVDGQLSLALQQGDRLSIRRSAQDFHLVRNPAQASWHTLTQKLKWGQ